MTDVLLHVTARRRGPARLDDPELDAPDPSIASLTARAASLPSALTSIVLTGGEPTLRADLPALLTSLPNATLRTDGHALTASATLRDLRAAGLGKLRVVLHSARTDAHDWLVGQPGAARQALRALIAAGELGITTEIEATLTRPTASHVAELVVLAEGVRARAVHLVRLEHRGVASRETIMLAPRFGLLEDPLDEAAAAAIRGRIALHVHGFPRCVAPRLGSAMAAPGARAHAFVEEPAWSAIREAYVVRYGERCASCPAAEACAGAPIEYVARFGSAEILSERPHTERPVVDAPAIGAPSSVAARAGRTPSTRLRDIRRVVRRGHVEGDPLIDRAEPPPPVLRMSFAPIETSTRVLRSRLIRAAQEGASVLRISGGFDHPAAPALLVEAARLPGMSVELAGDLTPLFGLADAQIFEMEGITRALGALSRPSDLDATLALLERFRSIAKIEMGAYVVLRGPSDAALWTELWSRLPGQPFVRLAGTGSLDTLADFTSSLVPSPYRDALARVLPRSHLASSGIAPAQAAPPAFVDTIMLAVPVGDDEPFGVFDACPCGTEGCPGIARGWGSRRLVVPSSS